MAEWKKPPEKVCFKCLVGLHDECDDHECTCEACAADDYWDDEDNRDSIEY
jgi:hypothetical protein